MKHAMAHPSAYEKLAIQGPPNGDFARYVQALTDALATTKPHTTMTQLTSRPIPAAAAARPATPAISRTPAVAAATPARSSATPAVRPSHVQTSATAPITPAPVVHATGATPSSIGSKPMTSVAQQHSAHAMPAKPTNDEDEDDEPVEPLSAEQIESLRQALSAQESASSGSGLKTAGRLLTGVGVALLLWVFFGKGGGLSVFIAIAALFFGSRLRNA